MDQHPSVLGMVATQNKEPVLPESYAQQVYKEPVLSLQQPFLLQLHVTDTGIYRLVSCMLISLSWSPLISFHSIFQPQQLLPKLHGFFLFVAFQPRLFLIRMQPNLIRLFPRHSSQVIFPCKEIISFFGLYLYQIICFSLMLETSSVSENLIRVTRMKHTAATFCHYQSVVKN